MQTSNLHTMWQQPEQERTSSVSCLYISSFAIAGNKDNRGPAKGGGL